ncbi:glycosyltransferase family 4 protein [Polynucleobacter sp. MWH-UH19D]|uniref:glycosyltransferase family 4 protein n=1 Tax=Polynucleobacter sp. MWH-UH19D TaxID=1855610 RepID=UPI0033650D04
MMVSRSWPTVERSGVSLAAQKHAKMLIDLGHELHVLGSNAAIEQESLNAKKYYIPSSGSGALYAPAKVDKKLLQDTIHSISPDLIILETWQTALTEAAIDVAYEKKIPSLMISHGISIHPYSNTVRNWIRYLAWLPYQYFFLTSRMKKLTAITALDLNVKSPRFYDRDLARSLHKPVFELTNSPAIKVLSIKARSDRSNQILVVGYFSEVKNQLGALAILNELPTSLTMKFVGKREGAYYLCCQEFVKQHQLEARAIFCEDHEVDLVTEFSHSILVLQTSITEALPITLLESMASGTPFVATPVGAVAALEGGLHASELSSHVKAVNQLIADELLWSQLSEQGKSSCAERYTDAKVREQLCIAVEKTVALALKG